MLYTKCWWVHGQFKSIWLTVFRIRRLFTFVRNAEYIRNATSSPTQRCTELKMIGYFISMTANCGTRSKISSFAGFLGITDAGHKGFLHMRIGESITGSSSPSNRPFVLFLCSNVLPHQSSNLSEPNLKEWFPMTWGTCSFSIIPEYLFPFGY